MAAQKKAAKAAGAAKAAQANPYIQRLIQDDELRQNIRQAFGSGRTAFGRLSNGKAPAKTVVDDKKFQRNVRDAATALRDAGVALREGPAKPKRRVGRKLFVLLVGAGAALALSESLRSKVLDKLFGAEEEFEYTPPTPSDPPPAAAPAEPQATESTQDSVTSS